MQFPTFSFRAARTARASGLALIALAAVGSSARLSAAPAADAVTLPGHVPAAVARAQAVGRLDAMRTVSLALSLPLRNQAGLDTLLKRLYDPKDPMYGHYLTPDQFAANYGPTQADYNRVIAFAQSNGLTVTHTHPNRTILDVSAPAAVVENAFGLHLLACRSQVDGRDFYAPDAAPKIPASLAGVVSGVVGLDNAIVWHPNFQTKAPRTGFPASLQSFELPNAIGTGPGGGLAPADIKAAYGLSNVPEDGTGQTLGLVELDGYTASDITAYETQFKLPAVPLTNVLLAGFDGTPSGGTGTAEVTLDIELQMALAPKATRIVVYEAPNSDQGLLDIYNAIANDHKNLPKNISTSWGTWEDNYYGDTTMQDAEAQIFKQMSTQGQSIYAATGDYGAYNPDTGAVSAQDPATQPYMCAVGGTTLQTRSAGGPYVSETTWAETSRRAGSGGGISTYWPIPNYQAGHISTASLGSKTMRNVPDVSLDANPDASGYAIYVGGAWATEGGTSCAAPLWAAFTALVNQRRIARNKPLLGFANPQIYLAAQKYYATDFHDVADGSTNFVYPAVKGLDDATGWGSFNGSSLLNHLGSGPIQPSPPTAPKNLTAADGNGQVTLTWTPGNDADSYNLYRGTTSGGETLYMTGLPSITYTDTGLTNGKRYYYQVSTVNILGESTKSNEAVGYPQAARQLLTNGGFENGSAKPAPWTASPGVIDDSDSEPAYDGVWKAWLDGYGVAHTDTLSTKVTIPSGLTTANLNFYLYVDTSETNTTTKYDTLTFQVRDTTGNVLGTIGTFSNLDAQGYYVPETLDMSAYSGKTVQLYIIGKEDSSLQTSFLLDDFSLTVQ